MKAKLTLYVEDEVIKKAKHYALDQDKSLSELIEELLLTLVGQ
jgi:predicted HicB family RNase H-like nuclease